MYRSIHRDASAWTFPAPSDASPMRAYNTRLLTFVSAARDRRQRMSLSSAERRATAQREAETRRSACAR